MVEGAGQDAGHRGGGSGRRDAIAGAVLGVLVGTTAAFLWPERPAAAEQPVAFDHRLHVRELEIDCATCHPFEEPAAFTGLPGVDACALCHGEPLGDGPEEAKVVRAIQSGAGLRWSPLFRQPPHVFFSHRTHVNLAGLECARCHPSIADARAPPPRVQPLRMDDCLDCHEGAGAPERCTACHR